MSSRPDPHAASAPSASADGDDHVARAAPVNPGAWDTRSSTLVDAADDGPAAPYADRPPAARGGRPTQVDWPEADRTDAPVLDADGVPLAEPPTGPVRPVPRPAGQPAPGRPRDAEGLPADPLTRPSRLPEPRADDDESRSRRRTAAASRSALRPALPTPEGLPGPAGEGPAGEGGARPAVRGAGRPRPAWARSGDEGHGTAPHGGTGRREGGGRATDPDASAARCAPAEAGAPARNPLPRRVPEDAGRPRGGDRRTGDPLPGPRAPRGPGPAGGRGPESGPRFPRGTRGATAAGAPPPGGSADPVRELMHRHRLLCERAVDPLEIAAGLEAHGITDRAAARYRHRDVFSLAEELYVRVPRADATAPDGARETGAKSAGAGVLRTLGRGSSHLLPGALCAATLAGLPYVPQTPWYARPAVGALGALAVLAAVNLSLRGVPRTRTAGLWACWLLGYVLYGDWLLTQLLSGRGRADALLPALSCPCVPLAMSVGVAPAAWCAHLFAARARRRLAGSRSLDDFAAGVRPLLLATVALFTVALLTVQGAAHLAVRGTAPTHATHAATVALGVLLFVALLLSAHGFPRAASAGPAAACLMIAAVLGVVLAARLPGSGRLARPVETAVAAYGPTVVPLAACALAALPLLGHALRVLAGASAHQRGAADPDHRPRPAR